MGSCEPFCRKYPNSFKKTLTTGNQPNLTSQIIQKQAIFESQTEPISEKETLELFSYKPAICKIRFKEENGKTAIGTGFFCKIHHKNIPFNRALFTNNHVLNEDAIKINQKIEFEYCDKNYKIEITKDRFVLTNKALDYTCIEILDIDEIKKFFTIDETIFNDKKSLKNKDIFVLQYPDGNLRFHCGKILDIQNDLIKHNVPTKGGSSGSPLIKRYNNNLIVGLHFGAKIYDDKCNLATPFDVIIQDIIDNFPQGHAFKKLQKINLIYNKKIEEWNSNILFGKDFVKNNINNITLIINGKQNNLIEEYNLKIGKNNVQMIMDNQLTNLKGMFLNVEKLENLEELKYLNTKKIKDFSWMFANCTLLSDISALKNWNVSNGKNFEAMFQSCLSLSDIKPLSNWNVSSGENFSGMFRFCSSLSDISALNNWNVSNGSNFSDMFKYCDSLSDITALKNWNVSEGIYFKSMFSHCSSLSDIQPLKNWNVSKGENFKSMFKNCSSLSNVESLKNWDISKGFDFKRMFKDCSPNLNLKPLLKWKQYSYIGFDLFLKEVL